MTLAAAAAVVLLLLPALWNGYPLLQYDTGGYLARWYEGYLVPSRSTVFGLYLHLGEGLHYWPVVIAQSLLTIWILWLILRVYRVPGGWLVWVMIAATLGVATSLPWLTSTLLTDIFAGLSVLAVHLLLFKGRDLRAGEKIGLFFTIAFAAASHSATLVILMAMLGAAAIAAIFLRRAISLRGWFAGAAALACGALMLLTANVALSGKLMWTPGGYGIAFGRMLQDGIVTRYLNEHCAHKDYKLCPYRDELPLNADLFLWDNGVFNKLGRFDGLGEEMREIVLDSLRAYPLEQIRTAAVATLHQLMMAGTGEGVHNKVWHTYGIIQTFIPREVPAVRESRQARGELDFTAINRLHIPVALLSLVLLCVVMWRFRLSWHDDLAMLAAGVGVAILANAFACGALSGPHDRYGARLAWVMTLVVAITAARLLATTRIREPDAPPQRQEASPAAP